ncbi:MAG: hypothetical protein KC713_09790 [Candidatus Omnitrophica bacterium]|nr:hypothetical protein [Candidatus Omnitrophota bacterium]
MNRNVREVSKEILRLVSQTSWPITCEEMNFYMHERLETVLLSIGWLKSEGLIDVEFTEDDVFISAKMAQDGSDLTSHLLRRFFSPN